MLKRLYPLEQAAQAIEAPLPPDVVGDHAIAKIEDLGGEPFRLADGRIVPINPGPRFSQYGEGRPKVPVKNPHLADDDNDSTFADEREASWGGGRWYIEANIIRKTRVLAGGLGGASRGSITNIGNLTVASGQKKDFKVDHREVTRGTQDQFYWWEPTGSRGVIYEIDYWIQSGKFANEAIAVNHIIDIDFEHDEVPLGAYIVQQTEPHWILSPLQDAPLLYDGAGYRPSPGLNFETMRVGYAEMAARLMALEAKPYKKITSESAPEETDLTWEFWVQSLPDSMKVFMRVDDGTILEFFQDGVEV